MNRSLLLLGLAALVSTASLSAQVPRLINYQGRVAVGGVNFDGPGQFKFALVDGTGMTTFWSNDGTSATGSQPANAVTLSVHQGLYSVLLGDNQVAHMTALPASAFTNADVRLRVWFNDGVNGSQLLTPDQRLAPAAYLASECVTAATIADGTISAAKIAPGAVDGSHVAAGSLDFNRFNVPHPPVAGQVLAFDGASLNWTTAGVGGGDSVFGLNGTSAFYSVGDVGIGTNIPTSKLDVRGPVTIDTGSNAAVFTGTGNMELNRYVTLLNSPGRASASGLKAGGVLVADSYSFADPGKNDLIVKGNVGIGTPLPFAPLDIHAEWDPNETPNINLTGRKPTVQWRASPGAPYFGDYFSWIAHVGASHGLEFWHRHENQGTIPFIDSGWLRRLALSTEGDLYLAGSLFTGGTSVSPEALTSGGDLNYAGRLGKLDTTEQFAATVRAADLLLGHSARRGSPGRALVDWNDDTGRSALIINWGGDWPETIIGGAVTEVRTLRITGGADLAEPFAMAEDISPGSVVVIDDEHPGQLKLSTGSYDTRVAGIVSGANGVNPGIALHQQGILEGGRNVALSGRVYVCADATGSPIRPGDLLTTSDTPGHAMKVMDPDRAQGAILGKAMSALDAGTGMVLVLVTLQ